MKTTLVHILYQADPEKLRIYREDIVNSSEDQEAMIRAAGALMDIVLGSVSEIVELRKNHKGIKYIGFKYDRQEAILGQTIEDIRRRAKRRYHNDEPTLDYITARLR